MTWRIATRGRRERAPLMTIVDLSRFLLACTAGALTMAVVSAVTSVVTGWGTPGLLALTTATSGLACLLSFR